MAQAILIIEDEAILAKNIAVYLQRAGYDTQVADSAESGAECLREFKPDVVLLDFHLPGRNGLEFLADLQAENPHLPVIMLTGQGSVELAVEAMKRGAADFLTKPLVLAKLRLVVERVLGAERTESTLSYYRQRESQDAGITRLIGESAPMRAVKDTIRRLIDAENALGDDEPPAVLITGETGTGKEVLARAIHYDGPRSNGPFIELNCGSIPPQLLEAELFGHERGAFTDAKERKIGLVEAADGGTLFLDEIGDMDATLQVKILKLLEEKSVRRLGSIRDNKVNVRIIAATHQPLEKLVSEGRFRSDLYFRLRIVQLTLAPLRDRVGDIIVLARHFLEIQKRRYNKPQLHFGPEAEVALTSYNWPGNVRELRNVIEQTVLLATNPVIETAQLPFCPVLGNAIEPLDAVAPAEPQDDLSLERVERDLLSQALDKASGNVTLAARLLGVTRDTLRYRMEKHGLSRVR